MLCMALDIFYPALMAGVIQFAVQAAVVHAYKIYNEERSE